MNRVASVYYCLALAALIVMIAGCAGGLQIIPLSVKKQNADLKFEKAEQTQIRSDTPEQKEKDLAKQKKLYDEALASYLEIIEKEPQGKYAQWSHFQVAAIYKTRYDWDKATEHYQTIVDIAPTGYLGSRAKSGIADIRKNRQLITDQKRVYDNRIDTEASQADAVQALLNIAKAYETLGNYSEAIRYYTKLVEEFPNYKQAPQAQYQIGNIYFYKLYDYFDSGGWGAFVKVAQKFPTSYEKSQAATLLKQSKDVLTEIAQNQAIIQKYTSKKALQYIAAGRKVLPSERYVLGYDDRIVQEYQNIAAGWVKMKNYPFAIAAYRELAENLSYKKFAAADALYRVAELYQQDGQYERAIDAYSDLFEKNPETTWRDRAVYNQAVCYQAIREFSKAYEGFKAYMSTSRDAEYYREADRIVRQMELDEDGDGYMFYQEQEAGTSDQDKNDHPGAKKVVSLPPQPD